MTITGTPAAHGTATVQPDGTIRYVPHAGFIGEDRVQYLACDTTTPTAACASEFITITVQNTFTPGPAVTDPTEREPGEPVVIPVDDIIDTPGGNPLDPSTGQITDGPDHGSAVVDPVTGDVTYTPDPGYVGPDEFEYRICDTSTPPQCRTEIVRIKVAPKPQLAGTGVDFDGATVAAGLGGIILGGLLLLVEARHRRA